MGENNNQQSTLSTLSAGLPIVGNVIDAISQSAMNRASRKWNEKMYNLQRQHSLQDWTMQNEYNSPEKQMQRLKAAGINPNMAFARGTVDNQGGVVRSTEAKSWNPQPVTFNSNAALNGISQYYDLKMKDAQYDNLKAQNTEIVNRAILTAAQTANTLQNTETSKFDLGVKTDLRATSLQAAQESLRKLQTDIDLSLRQDERAAASTAMNLTSAVENILSVREQRAKTIVEKEHIRQQISNLKNDNELKQLDINLKRIGVQPGDNILLRAAGQYLSGEKGPFSDIKKWYNKNFSTSGWKK